MTRDIAFTAFRLVFPSLVVLFLKSLADVHVRRVTSDDLKETQVNVDRDFRGFSVKAAAEAATFTAVGIDIAVLIAAMRDAQFAFISFFREGLLYLVLLHVVLYYFCLKLHKKMDVDVIVQAEECKREMESSLSREYALVTETRHRLDDCKLRDVPASQLRRAQADWEQAERDLKLKIREYRSKSKLTLLKKRQARISALGFPIASWLLAFAVVYNSVLFKPK